MIDWLGMKELLSAHDFITLLCRLVFDLVFAGLIIRGVYSKIYQNREYVFTYYLINVITFSLCALMRKVPVDLGFALGLFAVFGILRYRTEPIRLRDLTYLFVVIGIAIVNALANKKISLAELLVVDATIVAMTMALELRPSSRSVREVPLHYDRLDLLRPGNEAELYGDLVERTGLNVTRVHIKKLDMLRDAADIIVYYTEPGS